MIASVFGLLDSAGSVTTQDSPPQASAPATEPAANADPSGVIYLPNSQVSQSFAKGAVLYNGNPERNYRVHIFHRDKPGEVEVHTKDTDIFYILDGAATFGTGGTIVGGKDTAPGEVRAAAMEGGVDRTISKGDIVIIPANVPHRFKEIQQPILNRF